MIVGVIKETFPGEKRIALIPMNIAQFKKAGLDVIVESGAGDAAGYPDSTFEAKGAKIIGSGDLGYKINMPRKKDEIGVLSKEFNEMTLKLKCSKDEIENWNKTLAAKVEERTDELKKINQELKQMQFQLVESGKMTAIGIVSTGIAHELNNPLGGVIGYVQLIRNKVQRKEFSQEDMAIYEKYILNVERESKRCKDIVSNMLSYAKKSNKSFCPVDVREALHATRSIMEYQIKSWGIDMSFTFPDEPVIVFGNVGKLEQVFINLIANAHQAMPDGGRLEVTTKMKAENGGEKEEVLVTFSDTGCGIREEDIEKIFGTFFSVAKSEGGVGLGLAISRQIVEEHKGFIKVESEIGKGTDFIVALPLYTSTP